MDVSVISLRGGMNNTDPAIALPDDQCILAENVEFVDSMLGERRKGTTAISLPAFLSGKDRVPFIFRHLPSSSEGGSEFWALGVTSTTTVALGRKTTSWSEITISDTPTLTGFYQYQWDAVTLHGKIHFAYKSNVDRLHVWDGTSMRRSGLAEPAAPTGADTGSGSLSGVRYYRVRYTVQSGGTTVLRSEPSDVLTWTPSGSGTGIVVTKPASISEGETHWELEASTDNANFYRIATTAVGTSSVTDSTAYSTGYSSSTLSEDVGDYGLIPSARYLSHDEDRLIWAGSFDDDDLASRVGWTPVFGASGVGNDERSESDTDPFLDLDTYENGPITGITEPTLGAVWVFKRHAIYKLVRSGRRSHAYDAIKYTDALGAVHGSVLQATDEGGFPCIYFLDHEQGPCRIGREGIKRCGEDIRKTWELLAVDATAVVCSRQYYPQKKHVYWNIAVSGGNTPTKRLVLHTDKTRTYEDGVRKGWAVWTGDIAKALTMCLYAENIDDNTTRTNKLVPFIGLEGLGLIHRCDTGVDDNGVTYAATITTKPYWMKSLLQKFLTRAAVLLAKAVSGASITVKLIRDFGLETASTITVTGVSFTAEGSETDVIKRLDDFNGADMRVGQFQFVDEGTPSARWELNQFAVIEETGQHD